MTTETHPNGRHHADDPDRPLTDREELFVLHYYGAADCNGTDAARLAGFAPGAKSRNTWAREAHNIIRRPAVAKRMDVEREARLTKLRVTADDVLRKLLVIDAEAHLLPRNSAGIKTRLAIIEKIGDHVEVAAFRRQLGLGNPSGGPIETVDLAELAGMTDEEFEAIERAREILDRRAGRSAEDTERGDDSGGAGAPE